MDLETLTDLIEYNEKKLYYERIDFISVSNKTDLPYEDKLIQLSQIVDNIIQFNSRIEFLKKIIKENTIDGNV